MTESKNDGFNPVEIIADALTPVERRALRARAHALEPVVLVGDKGASYQTASAPTRSVSVAAAPQALIRFAPGATAADINKLLESNKVSLVSGPTAGGMYRIAVTGLSKEELIKVVKHLEENRTVVEFAAPAN